MGNAICLLREGGIPLLVTDPWLEGTCYYGSWALDHPLTREQQADALASPFIWISHGHPDHLHVPSLTRFRRDRTILLGEHYTSDIRDFLAAEGFTDVRICRSKEWVPISSGVRIMCVANLNQDTILAVDAGGTLIINQNDSPFCGEGPFFRRLCRRYERSYLLALCSVDADMLNYVDETGRSIAGPPELRKPGCVQALSRRCDYLGVEAFCCSSSQHLYVREDSKWANAYRIGWTDMSQYWCAGKTRLIEPFVTLSPETGDYVRNFPSQTSDFTQIRGGTDEDDWTAPLSEAEWKALESFIRQHQTLRAVVDFVEFSVAGESRRFDFSARGSKRKPRGVVFQAPRNSLMKTVSSGYFDDLLIGNFMKTRLVNMELYPHFSPLLAKYGGNAKVYTRPELLRFYWHYLRKSPAALIRFLIGRRWIYAIEPGLKDMLRGLGLFETVKSWADNARKAGAKRALR